VSAGETIAILGTFHPWQLPPSGAVNSTWRHGQDLRSLPSILRNPRRQLLEAGEPLLAAKIAHGLNDELGSIQVDLPIQQMHFHRRGSEGVHGGLGTQIHYSGHAGAMDSAGPGHHRVDALLGEKLAAIHLKIGRGPTEAPAETSARHHKATEPVFSLKQLFGLR